ncbi:MAG: hypothetical protein WKG03_02180 [Telluria sp.]
MTSPFARRLRALALAACVLAPASVLAQQAREPTGQERTSFMAWHQQQPKIGTAAPVYSITRDSAASPWRVQVYLDAPARRALRTLCRMDRLVYTYDGQWRSAPVQQFAWHAPSGCAAPARRIALGQRMPDTDILALIAQQDALLARARLVFAGNTACAAQRAYHYRLSAIDVSIYINGSEEMATLTYQSDRGPVARVWVRRTGLAYDPWNVSCP